jgi:hypothetical protein
LSDMKRSLSVVKKIFYVCIVVFWAVMMSLLVSRHYGHHEITGNGVHGGPIPESFYGEQWMGVYYKGGKIGYSRRKFERLGEGYKVTEEMKMNLNVFGTKKQLAFVTGAVLDRNLKMLSFDLSLNSDVDLHVSGRAEGGDLHLTFDMGGRETERVIRLAEVPSPGFSLPPGIFGGKLAIGRKFSASVFDPTTLSRGEMYLEVTGKERMASTEGEGEAYKIRGTMMGMEFSAWITERGEILREESPMGFVLVREKREDAVRMTGSSADVIVQASVPFNLPLPDDTRYLRVRLSGIDPNGFEIDGGRQRLEGDILEVSREDLSVTPSDSGGLKSPGEYLGSTLFVQSDDPRIISLSRKIVADERDGLRTARRISRWVYRKIEKTPSVAVPVATEVLKTRKGDCNEHTTLFTALSRAAGIPTRIALGLVYREGRFYYHAWPEIFIGRWIAVDPTLGQFPADAAHVRLITGDIGSQMRILGVIGKIKIEGLQYR